MNRGRRLDIDALSVETFSTTSPEDAQVLMNAGTWNDATAGCCRPQPQEPSITLDPGWGITCWGTITAKC